VQLPAASGKTTLFGDLPRQSATAILKLAEQYYVSLDGIVSRQERPEILKKGIWRVFLRLITLHK